MSRLFDWMDRSTCNFLAVDLMADILAGSGFRRLSEADIWKIERGGKYFVTKNGSALFAFVAGTESLADHGVRIISAHSDSPCFKLKPNCEIYGDGGMVSLNVEKYGGGILYTWFDRPLSISGRVMMRSGDVLAPREVTLDVRRPVAVIPHLAIHFNRAVNDGNPLSVQKDMKPVVGYFSAAEIESYRNHGGVIRSIVAAHLSEQTGENLAPEDITDYELCLYPAEKAGFAGVGEKLFQSARIDDLSMAFAGLEAMLAECDVPCEATRVLAVFDNEETSRVRIRRYCAISWSGCVLRSARSRRHSIAHCRGRS